MQIRSENRWDLPIPKDKNINHRIGVKIIFVLFALALCVLGWRFAGASDGGGFSSKGVVIFASDVRAADSPLSEPDDPNIRKTLAHLMARVASLESENQQLTDEMNQLLDHDGVISTLITHVRALHAQGEATRRDVVDALMAPLPDVSSPPPSSQRDIAGHVSPLSPSDGAFTPLLTKARHTIVTPVVATTPAAVAAAATEKRKAKLEPVEPKEGKTD